MDERYGKPPGGAPPPEDDDGGYAPLDGYDDNGFPTGGSVPKTPAPPTSGGYPPAGGGYPPPGAGYPPPTGGGYPPPGGDDNPYAPPAAAYPPQQAYGRQPYWQPYELAGRGTRLAAYILDNLVSLGAALPGLILIFMSLDSQGEDRLWLGAGVAFAGVLIVSVYQWYLISTRGQSLAKKWMHIRIVKLDGTLPGFVHGVLLRAWVVNLLANIPYVGFIVGLVDPLMIFGQERRCLHDILASTQVIMGDPEDDYEPHGY